SRRGPPRTRPRRRTRWAGPSSGPWWAPPSGPPSAPPRVARRREPRWEPVRDCSAAPRSARAMRRERPCPCSIATMWPTCSACTSRAIRFPSRGARGPRIRRPPPDQLRAYTDQVLKILEDPSLSLPDRRTAVRKVASEAFDVSETAKRALGQHWQQRTPAEREEFIHLFANLLEQTYISRISE